MRGKVSWQVTQVFEKSDIFRPGESKHADKNDAREAIASRGETSTSQRISDETKLHSYSTAYDYKECWEKFGEFARAELGLKDLEKTSPEHIQAYLESRIEDGIAHSTWQKEAAQLGKFGNALTEFTGRDISFRDAINELRGDAKDALVSPERDRGFIGPRDVVDELSNRDMRLVASLQLEGGARCSEVILVRQSQLRGNGQIELTNTKGGMKRTITVSQETYRKLADRLQNGDIRLKNSSYRSAVATAAKRAGEDVTGTHDFRYNYAQRRYVELTRDGHTAEEAHYLISREMGHHRPDITLHYL